MNILISASSHDGPFWVAFNLESLNLELEHHKNLHDAIQLCLINQGKKVFGEGNGHFGSIYSVIDGELFEDGFFTDYMLKGQCEFSDPDAEEYDPRYKDVTIKPPFQIDAVITLKTDD